jgi:D-alanine-D-alanine ligase
MALTVGVVFGGVSPEHEVSVISSLQAAAAMDRERYTPIPIYIAKDGAWYTGDRLLEVEAYSDLDATLAGASRVSIRPAGMGAMELAEIGETGRLRREPTPVRMDLLFLGLHGGDGENGGLQGLCEVMNVPYTGSGVFGSALGMDKVLSKIVCRDQKIPIVDFLAMRESDWGHREDEWLDRCESEIGYPLIAKPARLGSSIGIAKAGDRDELDAAIEEAFRYDDKVVVERAVRKLREINCAVLGDPDEAMPSVLEEPVPSEDAELLSYQDKYMRGDSGDGKGAPAAQGAKQKQNGEGPGGMASLDRIIPARLTEARTKEIQELAVRVFRLFECAGVARIDFMIDEETDQVFFNEINTIPGSFSFYLWDPTGIPFDELTHRMIEIGLQRHRNKNGRIRSYDVNLLSERSMQGLKGAKA